MIRHRKFLAGFIDPLTIATVTVALITVIGTLVATRVVQQTSENRSAAVDAYGSCGSTPNGSSACVSYTSCQLCQNGNWVAQNDKTKCSYPCNGISPTPAGCAGGFPPGSHKCSNASTCVFCQDNNLWGPADPWDCGTGSLCYQPSPTPTPVTYGYNCSNCSSKVINGFYETQTDCNTNCRPPNTPTVTKAATLTPIPACAGNGQSCSGKSCCQGYYCNYAANSICMPSAPTLTPIPTLSNPNLPCGNVLTNTKCVPKTKTCAPSTSYARTGCASNEKCVDFMAVCIAPTPAGACNYFGYQCKNNQRCYCNNTQVETCDPVCPINTTCQPYTQPFCKPNPTNIPTKAPTAPPAGVGLCLGLNVGDPCWSGTRSTYCPGYGTDPVTVNSTRLCFPKSTFGGKVIDCNPNYVDECPAPPVKTWNCKYSVCENNNQTLHTYDACAIPPNNTKDEYVDCNCVGANGLAHCSSAQGAGQQSSLQNPSSADLDQTSSIPNPNLVTLQQASTPVIVQTLLQRVGTFFTNLLGL